MADGHLNKCITCKMAQANKHRADNLERVLEYDRQRGNLPHRVEARREYVRTEQGREAHNRAIGSYRERYPQKAKAHDAVGNAVRDGRLVRPGVCSECPSTEKVEAHHDDYSKYLEVRWLCEACHKQWHRFNQAKFDDVLDPRLEWGPHCGYPRVAYDDIG